MNRQEKLELVNSLEDAIKANQASFLVEYKGLNSEAMTSLRRKLRSCGGTLKIAKVTLTKRAIESLDGLGSLNEYLEGPVAIVFSKSEPTTVAKVIYDFSKDHASFKIKGGCFEAKVIDQHVVESLATMPSKEQLLAELCYVMKSGPARFVYLLENFVKQASWTVEQAEEKKKGAAS